MFNNGAYPLRVGTSNGYIQFAGDREPSLGVDLMVLAADEMGVLPLAETMNAALRPLPGH